MFNGYRTYIIAALAGLVTFAFSVGKIDATTHQTLLGFLGAGGLITSRLGAKQDLERAGK